MQGGRTTVFEVTCPHQKNQPAKAAWASCEPWKPARKAGAVTGHFNATHACTRLFRRRASKHPLGVPPLKWFTFWDRIIPFSGGRRDGCQDGVVAGSEPRKQLHILTAQTFGGARQHERRKLPPENFLATLQAALQALSDTPQVGATSFFSAPINFSRFINRRC